MSILISFLEFLFSNIQNITGNYGISLIILSTIVNIILLPAYLPLEKWKSKAQKKQKPMQDEINEIKEHYFGHERYLYTQAIYRRYKYHPLQSLIMSLGLFIQIPFFIAAYNMLSHYDGFAGVSFLFIGDLSVPDAISNIGSLKINIMPILMTLINFISTFLYTKESGKAGRNQLYIIAGVFLVVLYTSPAALVLYWTMNNVFALIKQICHNKFEVIREIKIKNIFDSIYNKRKYLYWGTVALFIYFAMSYITFYEKDLDSGDTLVSLSIIILFTIQIISYIKSYLNQKSKKLKIVKTLFFIIPFILELGLSVKLYKILTIDGNVAKPYFKMIALIYLLGGISIILNFPYQLKRVINKIKSKIDNLSSKTIFYGSLSLILLSSFFWIPSLVYLSMPDSFDFSLFDLIVNNMKGFLITFIIFSAIFVFTKGTIKRYLTITITTLAITFFLYGFIIPFNFGTLEGFLLSDTSSFVLLISNYIFEFLLLTVIFITVRVMLTKYKKVLKIGIVVINLLILGQVSFASIGNDLFKTNYHYSKDFPEKINDVMAFSKDDENVIVFMLDAFRGGYVNQILLDEPELKEKLDGFTWFPNTLSISYFTNSSLPVLLGGMEYSPENMNKTEGGSLFNKTAQAYESLITQAENSDYKLSIIDPFMYHSYKGKIDKLKNSVNTIRNKSLSGYWETLKGSGEDLNDTDKISNILFAVGMLRSVPSSLKGKVYRGGKWFNNYRPAYKHARQYWATLDLLPEISNANGSGKTFKFINNEFTHRPYAMSDDGTLLRKGIPDPSAENFKGGKNPYYSAKWALIAIAEWVDWLKENEVYDNTKIILVSDHGNHYSLDYTTEFKNKERAEELGLTLFELNRLHPLLMVKDFNSNGDLEIDNRLMSNGDTNDIAFGLKDIESFEDRTLTSYRTLTWRVSELETSEKYNIGATYKVNNNIFDLNNWTKVEEE